MGRNTGIQWCDDTVNPTSGCDGCELYQPPKESLHTISLPDLKEHLKKQPCYAAQVHENRLAHSFPGNYAMSFSEVRLIPGRLQKCTNWPDLTGKDRAEKPWLNGMPRLIFISDMADALSEPVPFEYLRDEIIKPVSAWQKNRHVGMWLTKRPERMLEFARWLHAQGIAWPWNLWAGTSITTQATADKRIPPLLDLGEYLANVFTGDAPPFLPPQLFISCEPQRSPIIPKKVKRACTQGCDYTIVTDNPMGHFGGSYGYRDGARSSCYCQKCGTALRTVSSIGLFIMGGESGAHPKPYNVAWPRDLLKQFEHTAARFVKQLGVDPIAAGSDGETDGLHLKDSHGGDWNEWPVDLRVREMPRPREARP